MNKTYCTLNNSKLVWQIDKINNNKAYLSMGNKKLVTDISNIHILKYYTPVDISSVSISKENTSNMPNEIMLRHMTKQEAIDTLDKFIDKSVTNSLPRVKIIHGKNGGIIRKAVHDYLDNCEFISSYNFGDYHEGGFGVTIAYIKRYN